MELFAVEIDIVFALDGDQMDVCMGYFHAQHDDRYPCARYFALDFRRHLLGKEDHARQRLVVEVENVVHLLFRHDERMALRQRIDVEKCVIVVVFGDLVGGNLPRNDA